MERYAADRKIGKLAVGVEPAPHLTFALGNHIPHKMPKIDK